MGRKLPGLNTSSMSDISFLLLAFFLLVSNINTDQGIARRLPPPLPPNQEDRPEIKERNIFVVKINSKDRLLFNGEVGDIDDLRERAKNFLTNPYDDPKLPEKVDMDIPMLGNMKVSKGIISLQNDRGTSYDMYVAVQNELTAAINEIRNDLSLERFGRKYADLNDSQREAIDKAIPIAISEAEPTKIGERK
jgi:biopolymer transport protein ExbD